jgi:DGQHR domain-containing protein
MQSQQPPSIFPCITVNQPLGTFYVMSAAARDILEYLTVSRRGLSPAEREKVQRALDPVRQKEIAAYVTRDDATFPTSITVNADSERVFVVETTQGLVVVIGNELDEETASLAPKESILEIESGGIIRKFVRLSLNEPVAEIIDGQHRFEGLRKAIRDAASDEELLQKLQGFELTLAIMFDLVPEQCAKVFVTINATQRKVDSSHIADLFALHTTRSPQRVGHLIAVTANELEGSPFKGGLKMLGKRVSEGQYLSQGSFIKYLMTLLPKASESGELLAKGSGESDSKTRPLSDLYMKKDDKAIAKIVLDFFSAVADAYPSAWRTDSDDYLIRKTVGFAALTKLLRRLLPAMLQSNRHSFKHFDAVITQIKANFPEDRWKVGKFSSSDSDAGKIAAEMFGLVADKLDDVLSSTKQSD